MLFTNIQVGALYKFINKLDTCLALSNKFNALQTFTNTKSPPVCLSHVQIFELASRPVVCRLLHGWRDVFVGDCCCRLSVKLVKFVGAAAHADRLLRTASVTCRNWKQIISLKFPFSHIRLDLLHQKYRK